MLEVNKPQPNKVQSLSYFSSKIIKFFVLFILELLDYVLLFIKNIYQIKYIKYFLVNIWYK
jgi:hypothetical protein